MIWDVPPTGRMRQGESRLTAIAHADERSTIDPNRELPIGPGLAAARAPSPNVGRRSGRRPRAVPQGVVYRGVAGNLNTIVLRKPSGMWPAAGFGKITARQHLQEVKP